MNRHYRNSRAMSRARRLIGRHHAQIIACPRIPELSDRYAVTFRPDRHTNSFNGRLIQRIGIAVTVILSYGDSDPAGEDQPTMPLRGFRATVCPDGLVRYGGEGGRSFLYDAALPPFPRGRGGALSAARNPSMVECALQLDYCCKQNLDWPSVLPRVPQLPRILLGFAPANPPQFEDTPALRCLAANQLRIRIDRLGSNGSVLLERLLHDVWERQLISPTARGNPTGNVLIDAEFCTQVRQALGVYEDFSLLAGLQARNPVRDVRLPVFPNPARDVLRRYDIDMSQDFNQAFPDELLDRLEQAMREAIGPGQERFLTEEIFDALTAPGEPLVNYAACLPQLRARLPHYLSQCCTDDDLLRAARNPKHPLMASGACRVQALVERDSAPHDVLHFTPDDLGRRIDADLSGGARQVITSRRSARRAADGQRRRRPACMR